MQQDINNTMHDIFASYFENKSLQKVAYLVSKKLEEGHVCLDINQYNKSGNDKINIEEIEKQELVSSDADTNIQPFILLNGKLYLHRYFDYESTILNRINILVHVENELKKQSNLLEIKDFIIDLFDLNKNTQSSLESNLQLIASLNVVTDNFTIITGGPGTGKTTTVTKFLALLFKLDPNISIAIAAPTGKAAARLNESIISASGQLNNISEDIIIKFVNLKAQTIHRLLGVQYDSPYFIHNKKNPLKYDIVIIDESSMIDTALMAKLLESIDDKTKVVMLGDKNQLSSIGAGSIFGDLCKSQYRANNFAKDDIEFYSKFLDNINLDNFSFTNSSINILSGKIIELQKSYRFKDSEGIGKFSNLVINGIIEKKELIEPFRVSYDNQQYVKISQDYNDPDFLEILKAYEDYTKEDNIVKALEKFDKIRVLCAVREGEFGVNFYNNLIEKHLKSKGLLNPKMELYDRQAIMITANDYSLGLFNGDIGIIRFDDKTKSKLFYIKDENGKIKGFPIININQYETAFAMTIHKSQGSEFDKVAIIIPDNSDHLILTRELIYTAVTRAKKKVLILGEDDVLIKAIGRNIQRVSGINERINQM